MKKVILDNSKDEINFYAILSRVPIFAKKKWKISGDVNSGRW